MRHIGLLLCASLLLVACPKNHPPSGAANPDPEQKFGIGPISGGGSVRSVNASGGTTGLTFTGGPVTASGTLTLSGVLGIPNGGTGTTSPGSVAGSNISITGAWPNENFSFSGLLPVVNGGTGVSSPSLIAGSNVTITGTWPNQTINASAGGGGGGGGTVTSVDMTVPSWLSISGNPITAGGTLALASAGGQAGNLVLATPDNTTGLLAPRALVPRDIPTIPFSKLNTLPTTLSGYGITDAEPLDSDLLAIAALTTTSFGRGTLALADGAAFRTYIGAGSSNFNGAFSSLTGLPTTLSGYGIASPLPVVQGGSGSATPALVAGSGISLSGPWPNQTITNTRAGTVTTVTATNATPYFNVSIGTPSVTPAFSFDVSGLTTAFNGKEVVSAEGQFTDSGSTGTPTSWTTAKTTMRESQPLTTTRYSFLLPASSFAPGKIVTYIDDQTTGNFGRVFRRNGADTINGLNADIAPFISGASGLNGGKSISFETNGVNGWRSLSIGTGVDHFEDPLDASKQVHVDVSGQTPSAGFKFIPTRTTDGGSVPSLTAVPGQFVQSFTVGATPGADWGTGPVHWFDVTISQDEINSGSIVSNTHTVTADKNTARLSAVLSAPLTVVWPPATAYSSGQQVFFYDAAGSITPTNSVSFTSSGSDTFNGNPSLVITDAFANRTFTSDGISNWTVSTFGGSTGTGLNLANWTPLTDANVVTLNCDQSLNQQKNTLVSASGRATRVINVLNARPGETGQLWFIHNSTGSDGFTFSGGGSPSSGAGVIALSTGANKVDLVHWINDPNNKISVSLVTLDITYPVVALCTTIGDVQDATVTTSGVNVGSSNTNKWRATRFTPTTGNQNICRFDFNIWKVGNGGGNLTASVFADTGTAPGTQIGSSSVTIAASTVTPTNSTGADSTPTILTVPITQALTPGTTYYVSLNNSGANAANYIKWETRTVAGTAFPTFSSQDGMTWTNASSNAKGHFTTYH